MKNFIYTILIFFVIFCLAYPQILSFPVFLMGLIIISLWLLLIVNKKEYSILFCLFGYLHPFPSSQLLEHAYQYSFNILFIILLVLSVIILKIWTLPLTGITKINVLVWVFISYQIFISIIPNLINGELSLSVLFMEKDQFLGLLLIFPGYYLGTKYFFSTISFLIYFALFSTILFLLILYNVVYLVDLSINYVHTGAEGAERLGGLQFGQLFKIFIYAVPIAFLLKTRLKMALVFIGIALYSILLVTFSRYELIYISLGTLFSFYILFKYKLKGMKLFLYGSVAISLLLMLALSTISEILPNIDLIKAIDVTVEATKTSDQFFTFSHRFYTILPNQLIYFSSSLRNLLFGSGFNDFLRMNLGTLRDIGVWDMPLTGTLAKFGIFGFSIYMAIYLQIFKEIIYFYKLLSRNAQTIFANKDFHIYTVSIVLSSYLITCMIFRTYVINIELAINYIMLEYAFLLGLFLACINKLRSNKSAESITNRVNGQLIGKPKIY